MSFSSFCLGAWLITIANYWFGTKVGTELNLDWFLELCKVLFMPTLTGILQIDGLMLKNYTMLHILYAGFFLYSASSYS
jgi:NHS family xanthosine MFS transporter